MKKLQEISVDEIEHQLAVAKATTYNFKKDRQEQVEVLSWYIGENGYGGCNPPQDGKGNFIYDKVDVRLSKKQYEKLLGLPPKGSN